MASSPHALTETITIKVSADVARAFRAAGRDEVRDWQFFIDRKLREIIRTGGDAQIHTLEEESARSRAPALSEDDLKDAFMYEHDSKKGKKRP